MSARARYGIRYLPGTTLAARYPGMVADFATRETAEALRRAMVNAEHAEVVALPEGGAA